LIWNRGCSKDVSFLLDEKQKKRGKVESAREEGVKAEKE